MGSIAMTDWVGWVVYYDWFVLNCFPASEVRPVILLGIVAWCDAGEGLDPFLFLIYRRVPGMPGRFRHKRFPSVLSQLVMPE